MKQLAYITQGQSEFDDRLRGLLDGSGIDPEEFIGLEYFSLAPFFVLAGATVAADAHAHGDSVHVTGVRVTVAEELEEAFLATLPLILDDAYSDEDEDEDEADEVDAEGDDVTGGAGPAVNGNGNGTPVVE